MERVSIQLIILLLFLLLFTAAAQDGGRKLPAPVNVGVVLDLGTLVGKMGRTSISMAIDDFYASHRNYTTRLVLHTRDSNNDLVQATSEALDLLENTEVKAIIDPQKSTQAIFISELAQKSQVPLLSFSATSPSISSIRNPYFVRTTVNDSFQVPAIAALIKAHGWREAVPVYEDTEYGRGIMPYLIDAFQEIDASVPYRSVIPWSATNDIITQELYRLMTMQTRVFIVHVSSALGSRLFSKAKELGMMSEGYVWIMTDGLTDIVDSLNPSVVESMQGALGVKVHLPRLEDDFAVRWQRRFRQDNPNDHPTEGSVFGRWAYDTVWALAMAVEKVGTANSSFLKPKIISNSTELERLGVLVLGPRLLRTILETRFRGVSGEFRIVDGQLRSSTYQIINVVGRGGRGIGFWTPEHGISRVLKLNNPTMYSTLTTDLNPVIWPGESTTVPKGWEIPTNGKKLRIGVPGVSLREGYHEFVDVERDRITNATTVTGYCIDVFEAVIQKLPYALPREYLPFENSQGRSAGTYDALVHQVYLQNYDSVVGDTTIRANRSLYVDFTLPYTESGVAMIVPVKESVNKNAWIFLKPLTMDLWLGSFVFFFFTGFVVWAMEHRINNEFRGPISQQLGTIFYFSFSTLVFAHRERLEHILSKLVVVIWLFVMLILTSSYTASLTSMLTVQNLQPTVTDVHELQKNGDYVGYHKGSFVEDLLKQLNFDESKMRAYDYPEDYVEALSRGGENGGVAAIIHEIPYIKLFLAQHCTGYTMVGPIFKTAGFGFVFPKGSPLARDISTAILNVTEGDSMMEIEKKWFGDQNTCLNQGSIVTSNNLNFSSFWGLFLITGAASTCSLLIFLAMFFYKNWHELRNIDPSKPIWQRLIGWFRYFNTKDLEFYTFRKDKSININGDIGVEEGDAADMEASFDVDELQHQLSTSNISDADSYPRVEESSFIEQTSPSTETQLVSIVVAN